ncbi:MAG: hypothetical protein ACRC9R_10930 [Enterovibrio sp.]
MLEQHPFLIGALGIVLVTTAFFASIVIRHAHMQEKSNDKEEGCTHNCGFYDLAPALFFI